MNILFDVNSVNIEVIWEELEEIGGISRSSMFIMLEYMKFFEVVLSWFVCVIFDKKY